MKAKKKSSNLFFSGMISILFLSIFLSSSAQAQKAFEWKMLSSWGQEYPYTKNFVTPFVEMVNKRAEGRLKISWSGPEAVHAFEQLKPVREGLFDMLFTHSAYHFGEISLGNAMDLISATCKERRAAGLFKILDEAYRKKVNVTYLTGMASGGGYHLLLKKKIATADLTGLKIRTSPFYDPMITALGGAPVRIAVGEVYAALEKGVVDGASWSALGNVDMKLYEVTKYLVKPRFGEVVSPVLVNLNSWNRLPKDLQNLLMSIISELEEKYRAVMSSLVETEDRELQKGGMEFLVLPPKEAEKYVKTFYERSWEELVLKHNPELGPQLKDAVERMGKK